MNTVFRTTASIALVSGLLVLPVRSADLSAPQQVDVPKLVVDALTRHAVLYKIRVAFDVIPAEDVEALLEQDAKRMIAAGSDTDQDAVSEDLLAEGSYYAVSLRYLVEVGGANWPTTKPDADYSKEALQTLARVQHQWIDAVEHQLPLIDLAKQLDRINAQTEGYDIAPPERLHFEDIDALVQVAIEHAAPTTHI